MLNRRKLLAGLGIGLAAPAIIRTPGLLMPVRRALLAKPAMSPAEMQSHRDAASNALTIFPSGAFAPATPPRGATYFDTTMMKQRVYDGSQWLTLAA